MFAPQQRRTIWMALICAILCSMIAVALSFRSASAIMLDAVGDLNSKNPIVSAAAKVKINTFGTNVIPLLIGRLHQSDSRGLRLVNLSYQSLYRNPFKELIKSTDTKQSEAVTAFKVLGESVAIAVPTLFEMLTNANLELGPIAASRIAQCIAFTGPSSKQWLVKGLGNSAVEVRRACITALALHFEGQSDLCSCIADVSTDSDSEVRELALYFLSDACASSPKVWHILQRAVGDPDMHVRRLAEKNLRKIQEKTTPASSREVLSNGVPVFQSAKNPEKG